MKRSEFGKLLNLSTDLVPVGKNNRPQTALVATHITIHNTDNTDAGADALAHAKFLKTTGYYIHPKGSNNKIWVSWHYTVDENRIVKHIPTNEVAYHAKSGNNKSIGIEICMNHGINQQKAFERAAKLIAVLLYDYKLTIDKVVTHSKWTGKKCPSLLLDADGTFGKKWQQFKDSISAELKKID
jgi:N-acetylmuramoyl-L-alanine amidase